MDTEECTKCAHSEAVAVVKNEIGNINKTLERIETALLAQDLKYAGALKDAESKFANKWVESAMKGGIMTVITAVILAVLGLVFAPKVLAGLLAFYHLIV